MVTSGASFSSKHFRFKPREKRHHEAHQEGMRSVSIRSRDFPALLYSSPACRRALVLLEKEIATADSKNHHEYRYVTTDKILLRIPEASTID